MENQDTPVEQMRANLTDEVYQEMIANPDGRFPFLIFWPKVQRELSPA